MADITHIADVKNDNRLIKPATALRKLADDIDSGKINVDRMLVLWDSAGDFGFDATNVTTAEMLFLTRLFEFKQMQEIIG